MQLLWPALPAKVPAAHAEHVGLLPHGSDEVDARNWPIAQFIHPPAAEPPHVVWY
jgi:hypothetical protein